MGTLSEELKTSINNLYGGVDPASVPPAARAEVEFASDPQRIEEAKDLNEVAEAFARVELHPPDGRGLGVRGGRANAFPALGILLGKKNPRPGSRQSDQLLDGIKFALACGYMASLALEPDNRQHYKPAVPPGRVWAVTVANFRADGVRKLGCPSPVVDNLERFGEDAIADAMRVAGIGGWHTRKAHW